MYAKETLFAEATQIKWVDAGSACRRQVVVAAAAAKHKTYDKADAHQGNEHSRPFAPAVGTWHNQHPSTFPTAKCFQVLWYMVLLLRTP